MWPDGVFPTAIVCEYQLLIGYTRTSTVEQVAGLESQEAALAATGCSKIVKEQASSVGQRDGLAAVPDFVREDDTLAVGLSGISCAARRLIIRPSWL